MRTVISTEGAPRSPLYSQAVTAGPLVFVSGLVGIDATAGVLTGPGIRDQTRRALSNCRTVLEAAGATLDDVVEVGVLLTRPDDFADMNAGYEQWFPRTHPHATSPSYPAFWSPSA